MGYPQSRKGQRDLWSADGYGKEGKLVRGGWLEVTNLNFLSYKTGNSSLGLLRSKASALKTCPGFVF